MPSAISHQPSAMLGLYLHIPFCSAICNYCNFNRGLFDADVKVRYVDAMVAEIAALKGCATFGGTSEQDVAQGFSPASSAALKAQIIHEQAGRLGPFASKTGSAGRKNAPPVVVLERGAPPLRPAHPVVRLRRISHPSSQRTSSQSLRHWCRAAAMSARSRYEPIDACDSSECCAARIRPV